MIRILFDELANSHSDLFLRIEALPTYVMTAGSYYIADFLKLEDDSRNSPEQSITNLKIDAAIEFVKYIQDRILNCKEKCFVLFDISDEYIKGLIIERDKKEFIIKVVFTKDIDGYEIDKDNLDELIRIRNANFEQESPLVWKVSEEEIVKGLTMSIVKMKTSYIYEKKI